jgi:hypothetical protein
MCNFMVHVMIGMTEKVDNFSFQISRYIQVS